MLVFFISLDPGMDQIQSTLSQILLSLQSCRKKLSIYNLLPTNLILTWIKFKLKRRTQNISSLERKNTRCQSKLRRNKSEWLIEDGHNCKQPSWNILCIKFSEMNILWLSGIKFCQALWVHDLLKTRTEDLKTTSWKAHINIFSAREIFQSKRVFIDFWTVIYLLEGL